MSLLDELKQQKAEIAERLERACADVQYFDGRMADLLLAIAALEPTPADLFAAEKETAREQLEREPEEDSLAPEGMPECAWETVTVIAPVPSAEMVIGWNEARASGFEGSFDDYLDLVQHGNAQSADDLDEQDDASEFGDPDRSVYGDGLAYGDGNDDRINNVPFDLNPYDGKEAEYWSNGWNDADAVIKLNEPAEFISDLTGDPAIEPESGLHEEAPALNEQMQDEREEPVALAQPEWNEPPQPISMIDEQTCEPVDPTLRAFEDDHIVEPQPTEGYAPVTNPEADALARAHDWYSPEKVAERNKFNPWGIFGKKLEDA